MRSVRFCTVTKSDDMRTREAPGATNGQHRWLFFCDRPYPNVEVGLQRDDFVLLGSLSSFRFHSGILLHPSVALLRILKDENASFSRPFFPRLNVNEVEKTFWMSLDRFLDDSLHTSFNIDKNYTVHSFMYYFIEIMKNILLSEKKKQKDICVDPKSLFEEAHTFGVTALLCIMTAMCVLQRMPSFDIMPMLTVSRLADMTPVDVMAEVRVNAERSYTSRSKI
ncbi:hypothetical protein DICVIV_06393 [Dictyocaulus viviparus]|uniref:Uncharacterized protein n=1 Tax=Dictyocaulus viviparus TaxID=29172 RepID=A0A0D8XYS2_DICVI|nr:hypothetical protein DICVIV_06393 [Dictyocaulus viviparus]